MYGLFFFEEIDRLNSWLGERIASATYEPEEVRAGIHSLNDAFGVYATIDMISKHTGLAEDELVKWTFYRFYNKVGYLSNVNEYERRLTEEYKRSRKHA